MATLLTNLEAISLANINKEFPPCDIQSITQVEINAFDGCFTLDFYNSLLANLENYSSVQTWLSTTEYATGDLVLFMGRIYEALDDSTNKQPMTSTFWKLADKFTDATLNELWNTGLLGRWLSLQVIERTIPYMATQVTGKGLTQSVGSDYQPASSKAVDSLQVRINQDVIQCLKVVKLFIKNNPTYNWIGLDDIEGCGCSSGKTCNKKTGGYLVC